METIDITPKTGLAIAGEKISTGLVAFDERTATLTALKNKSTGLKISSIDDKAGLQLVSKTRKELKAARVEIEKEGLAMRSLLSTFSKDISAKEKELIAIIEPTEIELQAEEDRISAEKEVIRLAEEAAKQKVIQDRIDTLALYGYAIDYAVITTIDQPTFDKVLSNAKLEFEKEQEAKAEVARLAQIESDKLEADKKELAELREKQVAAQAIIDTENARIKKEQEDKELAILKEQNKIEAQKKLLEADKAEAEKERVAAIALQKVKDEAAETARLKALENVKIATAAENKRIADEKAELERQAALAPDKEKLQLFSDNLSTLKLPVVTGENSQLIVNEIQLMINKMQAHIIKKIKDL